MYNEGFLRHYGVLGMHWGKGKARAGSRTPTKKKAVVKRPSSDDHNRKVVLKSKKIHELSNEQLQELTKRLQLEKQARDLNPSDFNKGLNIVKKATAVGTTFASFYALSKTPMVQDISKAIKSRMK